MTRPENEETIDKAVSVWAIPHHFTTLSPVNYTHCRDKGLLSSRLMKWASSHKLSVKKCTPPWQITRNGRDYKGGSGDCLTNLIFPYVYKTCIMLTCTNVGNTSQYDSSLTFSLLNTFSRHGCIIRIYGFISPQQLWKVQCVPRGGTQGHKRHIWRQDNACEIKHSVAFWCYWLAMKKTACEWSSNML